MKKSFLLFAAIAMSVSFSTAGMAQVTSTEDNNANAQILGAITLTALTPLEFGGIVANSENPGTVTMSSADVRDKTVVTLVTGGRVLAKSASYSVTGTGDALYSIVIPTAPFNVVNTTIGTAAMSVTDMICSKGLTSTIDHTGTDAFKVGGTLNVLAAQTPGIYTAKFDVTVAY